MPTLIIEDGTMASASANSYVTIDEVTTFCANYGLSAWAAATSTSDQIPAVFRGMAYVETFNFKGVKMDYSNPLEWPRYGVYDEEDVEAEDLQYYQEIPNKLKDAVCRAAYEEFVSPGVLQPTQTTNIRREKIDVLEVEYFGRTPSSVIYPTIAGFLKSLLQGGGTATVLRT